MEGGAARSVRTLAALYAWFVSLTLCGLATLTLTERSEIGFAVASASVAMSLAALILNFVRTRRMQQAGTLAIFALLTLVPIPVLTTEPGGHLVFVHLYFVLLLAAPALLRVWTPKVQCLAGLYAASTLLVLWGPIDPWTAAQSILLVLATTALACVIVADRSPGAIGDWFPSDPELSERLRTLEASEFPRRMGNVLLLQAVLITLLLFVGLQREGTDLFWCVQAGLGLILTILGVRALPARYAPAIVAVSTVLIGVILTSADYYSSGTIASVLPLLFLVFTTVLLPWSIELQIAVAWCLPMFAVFTQVIRRGGSDHPLGSEPAAVAFLVLVSAASAVIAQVLRQRRLMGLTYSSADGYGSVGERSEDSLLLPALKGFQEMRLNHLVGGLALLGVVSNTVTTYLLRTEAIGSPRLIALGWGAFVILWGTLLLKVRNQGGRDEVWIHGTFAALLFLIWPSVVLLMAEPLHRYWLAWPIIVLVAIGGIPWRASELLPVTAMSAVASFALIDVIDVQPWGALFLCFPTVAGLVVTRLHLLLVKENYYVANFAPVLEQMTSEEQCLQLFGAALLNIFGQDTALLKQANGRCFLLRGGEAHTLSDEEWPVRQFLGIERHTSVPRSGASVCAVNWLTAPLSFLHARAGLVRGNHLLFCHVVYRMPDAASDEEPVGTTLVLQRDCLPAVATVCLPLLFPFFSQCLVNERHLVQVLGGMLRLRLEALSERDRRLLRAKRSEALLAEREYELSTLVHDINNTVQDLTLLCDDIADAGSGEFQGRVQRIANLARSMATVVSDAKRRRELERFQDLAPRELVDVQSVVRDLLPFAVIRGERKRISISASIEEGAASYVRISANEHLETILRNLLDNAITYSAAGSTIHVSFTADKDWVRVEVSDNGPGLTEEQCEGIFASGTRAGVGARTGAGLGIGLAHSRRVAQSAGGTLVARSPGLGCGSTFILTLPRSEAPVGDAWSLIVDDQPALTEVYSRIAKALHLIPLVAHSVDEALTLIRANGRPSFVVTDLHLGTTSGLELIEYLRAEFGPHLPILVVSGLTDRDTEERARHAGATDFVAKPVGRRALFARIESLVLRLTHR